MYFQSFFGRRPPAASPPVAIAPSIEADLIAELARVNDSICGVGANWPHLCEFSRKLRIQGMRCALQRLANVDQSEVPGVDQESLAHLRAVLAVILSKGDDGHVRH